MKRFVLALCLTFCLCFLALTSFAQAASAAHAYANLLTFECSDRSQFNYKLEWKSLEEVPSPPEANEYSRLWPTNQEGGILCNNGNVIEINEKHQFPIDLDEVVRLSINTGRVKDEQVMPATESLPDNVEQIVFDDGLGNVILKYTVTFE
jgi:hypothetical protein